MKDSNQSELGRRNGSSMLSVQASERALLCFLMDRINTLDPDVLVGHNVSAFDLDILLHRLQHHKVHCINGLICYLLHAETCCLLAERSWVTPDVGDLYCSVCQGSALVMQQMLTLAATASRVQVLKSA